MEPRWGSSNVRVAKLGRTFIEKTMMKNRISVSLLQRWLVALPVLAGVLLTACAKDEPAKDYTQIDADIISKYISDNHISTARRQPSGLYYVPIRTDSTGVRAVAGKTVSVLYTGKFMDGRVFDASSRHGNVPIDFVLGRRQVIAGWDEGIALMRKGEKGELLIPSALAYGPDGSPPTIPGNAVMRFEVELVNVR